jgi:hypothetical protein
MGQLGHTDPKFALRVYSHAIRRGDQEREELRALVEGAAPGPHQDQLRPTESMITG